jgi:hypothetical protein
MYYVVVVVDAWGDVERLENQMVLKGFKYWAQHATRLCSFTALLNKSRETFELRWD